MKKSTIPFSFRLTEAERAALDRAAGKMPLGTYIKWRLIDPDADAPRRRRTRRPSAFERGLSQALALLGNSRIASNLNQVAKAANAGAVPLNPELDAELREALAHIAEIRRLLIESLELQDPEP